MKQTRMVFLLLLLVALLSPSWSVENGLARHKRFFAVPAPGKVVIDGKLDDWDLSGQIELFVTSATKDIQGARFAMMYDKHAIYLSGVVRDIHPMMNRHDPQVSGDYGWDADACEFRMCLDPSQGYPLEDNNTYTQKPNDQLAHMTLWYYTDRKEPVVVVRTGMNYTPIAGGNKFGALPHNKFQAAYRMAADGKGYTFEYRIPWKSLSAKNPPKPGDIVAGTVQFDWGRADGLKTQGISSWAYDVMAHPGFTFQNAGCWGKFMFSKDRAPAERTGGRRHAPGETAAAHLRL